MSDLDTIIIQAIELFLGSIALGIAGLLISGWPFLLVYLRRYMRVPWMTPPRIWGGSTLALAIIILSSAFPFGGARQISETDKLQMLLCYIMMGLPYVILLSLIIIQRARRPTADAERPQDT